jgi:hypothetical protein
MFDGFGSQLSLSSEKEVTLVGRIIGLESSYSQDGTNNDCVLSVSLLIDSF